jgi:hypothetical protein
MKPIRNKLIFLLILVAHKDVKALRPQSPCAKQLREIENLDEIIA